MLTIIFSFIISIQDLFSENHPPAPKGSGGFGDGVVVGGTAPIDDFIPLLFFAAILLGVWIINKKQIHYTS